MTLNQIDRTALVQHYADYWRLSLEYIQPWHLRLSHPDGRRLDYFPKSGRATWVSSGRWFVIEDVEQYLLKEFKPAIC